MIFESEQGENSPHGTRTIQHIHRQETICLRLKHDTSYSERMSYCRSFLLFLLKRFTNTGSFMSERCYKWYKLIDSYSLRWVYSTGRVCDYFLPSSVLIGSRISLSGKYEQVQSRTPMFHGNTVTYLWSANDIYQSPSISPLLKKKKKNQKWKKFSKFSLLTCFESLVKKYILHYKLQCVLIRGVGWTFFDQRAFSFFVNAFFLKRS